MDHDVLDYFNQRVIHTTNTFGEVPGVRKDLVHRTPGEWVKSTEDYFTEKHRAEITITFRDSILDRFRPDYIQRRLKDFLNSKQDVVRYLLVQDYSDVGRLHYHGVLEIVALDKLAYLKKRILKEFGRVEIQPIRNRAYYDYIFGLYIPGHDKYKQSIKFDDSRVIENVF